MDTIVMQQQEEVELSFTDKYAILELHMDGEKTEDDPLINLSVDQAKIVGAALLKWVEEISNPTKTT